MTSELQSALHTILRLFRFEELGHGANLRAQAASLAQNSALSSDARHELLEALRVIAAELDTIETTS